MNKSYEAGFKTVKSIFSGVSAAKRGVINAGKATKDGVSAAKRGIVNTGKATKDGVVGTGEAVSLFFAGMKQAVKLQCGSCRLIEHEVK